MQINTVMRWCHIPWNISFSGKIHVNCTGAANITILLRYNRIRESNGWRATHAKVTETTSFVLSVQCLQGRVAMRACCHPITWLFAEFATPQSLSAQAKPSTVHIAQLNASCILEMWFVIFPMHKLSPRLGLVLALLSFAMKINTSQSVFNNRTSANDPNISVDNDSIRMTVLPPLRPSVRLVRFAFIWHPLQMLTQTCLFFSFIVPFNGVQHHSQITKSPILCHMHSECHQQRQ